MELTSQLASIEEDVKLLKGEIKSILKEIRAAVLSSDNPFSSASGAAKVVTPPSPGPDTIEPVPAGAPDPSPFSPHPGEVSAFPAAAPAPFSQAPGRAELKPIDSTPRESDEIREPAATSLFTIASLLVWAEDAMNTLGARRFRIMLELAYSAELLSPEVRDVLRDLAEVWSTEKEPDRPVNVNEVLLHLRQLEAIVNGERVTRIPRRRVRRRGA